MSFYFILNLSQYIIQSMIWKEKEMVYNLYEVTVSLLRERGLEIKDIAELVLFSEKVLSQLAFITFS